MPLESALHGLTRNLEVLSQKVAELCAIAKDRPESTAVADAYEEIMDDIQMCLLDAYTRVTPLAAPIGAQKNPEVWQALLMCQARIDHVASQLCHLQSMDQVAPLLRFGVRQGGEWPIWARLVKEGVTRCLPPLYQVQQAQLVCWQEMAEHSTGGGVMVHNTAIGQQISWPDDHPPLGNRDR